MRSDREVSLHLFRYGNENEIGWEVFVHLFQNENENEIGWGGVCRFAPE